MIGAPRHRPAPAVRPQMEALPLEREELAAWLRMTMTPKLGNVAFRRLCCAFGLPEQVLLQSEASLARCVGSALAASLAASLVAPTTPQFEWQIDYASMWLEEPDHHLVTLGDPAYPPALLASPDPPMMIYVRGRLELLHPGVGSEPAIAIVGSRRSSAPGRTHAGQFARELGTAGVTVVSGLAQGIDAAAHWGALGTIGSTVAILGTGAGAGKAARNGTETRMPGSERRNTAASPSASASSPGSAESRVLAERGHHPAPIDVLVARTGLSGAAVQAAVLALELDGRIEWLPGARTVSTQG